MRWSLALRLRQDSGLLQPATCDIVASPRKQLRHWTDWAGCLLYITIAVDMVVHAPQIGILLLPSVLHELIAAASFLIRRPLARQSNGWQPRLAAYLGSFLVIIFIRLSSAYHPSWVAHTHVAVLNALGFTLWLIGILFGLYSLWYFRHAFSLIPQARVLVTSGPFCIARHPIYLSYVLQYLGIWLTRPTLTLLLILSIWFALICIRIKYEEALLLMVFPEYAAYQSHVRVLYPGLPRRVVRPGLFQVQAPCNKGGKSRPLI
ncbi:MAG: putative protein-S-isoprenylcysteine O-methyltransferase [Acidobacteriaceae bacterium]|nr:putative protein-S-isoprenylcysteine O-methyltransferase [Acidobacteriaceae bacterium]